ncbi:hypothetical protein [uncultured Brachyspira sp.]|uniref:hypothetical protein n=1 Tax=uncultured Brachyspira sp. TaxID=221953 RepID=UPI0025DDE40F|nr:hypothetical protein [uncultured Brachyspira sp.]
MNRKINFFIFIILSLFIIISCASRYSYVRVDDIIEKKRNIAIASFTFPKSMTNQYLDKLKYLNTEIYADFVLNSFISNFNSQNEMVRLITLEEAIGNKDFAELPNHSILGADYVAATGTLATNRLSEETLLILADKVDGIMYANSAMSFWSQKVTIDFEIYDIDGDYLWIDTLNGDSYHIIGDTGSPTRQTAYEIVIADVMKYQKRHAEELYIVIDQAISNGVSKLKGRAPYAFNTNDIIFTQKTLSLTNEDYTKERVYIDGTETENRIEFQ